jgi:hypothetical protein
MGAEAGSCYQYMKQQDSKLVTFQPTNMKPVHAIASLAEKQHLRPDQCTLSVRYQYPISPLFMLCGVQC